MPFNKSQPPEQHTFYQDYKRVQWLTQFPALTAQVFLRRDLGYRLLHPGKLLIVNGALAVFGILAEPGNEEARPIALTFFAAASFCAGMVQRARRWRDLDQPARRSSLYIGTSPFNFHWLPIFVRRNRRVSRFLDPIICALIGFAVFPLSHALGCYLAFAGFCLRATESEVFERERNYDLDLADSLVTANHQSDLIEQHEGSTPQSNQSQPGLSTGLGRDLQEHIQRRKTKSQTKK